jgi:spore germination protein GerM
VMDGRFRTRGTIRIVVLAASASLMVGCTIAPDASPRDIPAEERTLLVSDASEGAETAGDARIYLVAPTESGQQRQLRSVQRDSVPLPNEVLGTLFNGPNQSELDSRLVTQIPSRTELLSTRLVGETLFVDISEEILELTGEALTLAVAQIVFTASEIPGVQTVRLRVDGDDQSWPRGDGQPRSGSLRTFDFPGFVESSQPPYPAAPPA